MSKAAVQIAMDTITLPTQTGPLGQSETQDKPTGQDVATIAYHLWEVRGRPDGDPDRDWYEAERLMNAVRPCDARTSAETKMKTRSALRRRDHAGSCCDLDP